MTTAGIAGLIRSSRYRGTDSEGVPDASIEATWRRVARACASLEQDRERWERRFESALAGFRVLPGGRIVAAWSANVFDLTMPGKTPDTGATGMHPSPGYRGTR